MRARLPAFLWTVFCASGLLLTGPFTQTARLSLFIFIALWCVAFSLVRRTGGGTSRRHPLTKKGELEILTAIFLAVLIWSLFEQRATTTLLAGWGVALMGGLCAMERISNHRCSPEPDDEKRGTRR